MYRYIIGIDPGVNTGIAIWDNEDKELLSVTSCKIHEAMRQVLELFKENHILVRFEDARQRKWFGNSGREQLQGAGSVKRDCGIWQDYIESHGMRFEAVAPKNNKTKLKSADFKKLTKWGKPTNEHGRDAAMLVFGY